VALHAQRRDAPRCTPTAGVAAGLASPAEARPEADRLHCDAVAQDDPWRRRGPLHLQAASSAAGQWLVVKVTATYKGVTKSRSVAFKVQR
jgi:hypothetical protein